MGSGIKEILAREKFQPGLLGFFINHNFLIRTSILKAIRQYQTALTGNVLDFGCGTKPYERFFTNVSTYTGVDYLIEGREEYQRKVDVFYNGKTLPFSNDSFDSILCTEVLEHVFNIDELLVELCRVLKPCGAALMTTPFMWEEHEMPYDFARYTTPALKHLYSEHGFEIEKHVKTGNYVKVIIQFQLNYLKNILPDNKMVRQICLLPFIWIFNLAGVLASAILPVEQTAYFNNVFLLRKK